MGTKRTVSAAIKRRLIGQILTRSDNATLLPGKQDVTSWHGMPTRIRFVVGSVDRPKVQCIISDAQIMRNSKIRI